MGDYWNEDIVRTSVVNQKLDIEGEHPAPFPEEIITLPILQTSKEFELILDPFMGSGTTAVAAHRTNRNYIGSELSSEYHQLSIERLQEETTSLENFL